MRPEHHMPSPVSSSIARSPMGFSSATGSSRTCSSSTVLTPVPRRASSWRTDSFDAATAGASTGAAAAASGAAAWAATGAEVGASRTTLSSGRTSKFRGRTRTDLVRPRRDTMIRTAPATESSTSTTDPTRPFISPCLRPTSFTRLPSYCARTALASDDAAAFFPSFFFLYTFLFFFFLLGEEFGDAASTLPAELETPALPAIRAGSLLGSVSGPLVDAISFSSVEDGCSRSSFTRSPLPDLKPSVREEWPNEFVARTSTTQLPSVAGGKAASRTRVASIWPLTAAQCRGVLPLAFAWNRAPAFTRISTTSEWPLAAALCSAELPP
mmetsp:Transcript_31171/g.90623  ORF Transcript_31171/g.90623 Transcript_31171/m.90623 type:complete len:326 (-) Transcript_31171:98-1075(-)